MLKSFGGAVQNPSRLTVNKQRLSKAGCQGWWLASQRTVAGARWKDLCVGRNDGILTAMPYTTHGLRGTNRVGGMNQMAFAGASGAQVSLPLALAKAQTGDMTVCCWINLPASEAANILSADGLGGAFGFDISTFQPGIGVTCVSFKIASGPSTAATLQGTVHLAFGVWYHVCCVYQAGSLMAIYVNGTLDTSSSTSIPASQNNGSSLGFNIGNFGQITNQPFNGFLDDVQLWNVAFDANRVKDWYRLSRLGYPGWLTKGASWDLPIGSTTTATAGVVSIGLQVAAPSVTLGAATEAAGVVNVTVQTVAPSVTLGGASEAAGVINVGVEVDQPAVQLGPVSEASGVAIVSVEVDGPPVNLGPVSPAAGVVPIQVAVAAPGVTLGTATVAAGVDNITLDVQPPSPGGQTTVAAGVVNVDLALAPPAVQLGTATEPSGSDMATVTVISPTVVLGTVAPAAGVATIDVAVVSPVGPPVGATIEIWQPRARATIWTLDW